MENLILKRFMKFVEKQKDGCWRWKGMNNGEYGYFKVRSYVKQSAHRFSWEFFNQRPIPKGLIACHRCDYGLCVNPHHIFIGTDADNVKDKISKGRQPSGENHCNAKLSDDDVVKIKRLRNEGMKFSSIHKSFPQVSLSSMFYAYHKR